MNDGPLHDPWCTVVIPTFNRRELLVEAIGSVLRQDEQDFEVIIVDDGSTDGTSEALPTDSRIRIIRNDVNRKRGVARNMGIEASRGRFVAFLDDDDLFEPWHLSQARAALSSGASVAISSGARYWDPTTGETRRYRHPRFRGSGLRRSTLLSTVLPLPSLVIERDVALACGGFPEAPEVDGSEDFVFLARLAAMVNITLLERHSLLIRQHPHRGMLKTQKILDSRQAAARLLLTEGLDHKSLTDDEQALVITGTHRFSAALYYERGSMREARSEVIEICKNVGLWRGTRMGGRLFIQTLLGKRAARGARELKWRSGRAAKQLRAMAKTMLKKT